MSSNEGIVREVISPLIDMLEGMHKLLGRGNTKDSPAINDIVRKIRKQLKSLKKDFELGKEVEWTVSEGRQVVQDVEEMLKQAVASDSTRNARLEGDLKKIEEKITSFSKRKTERDSTKEWDIQESDAMSHLRRVIENLDTRLKHCLFCLTVFPVDSVIKKRLLIHWWIGENIVSSAAEGKECFNELSLRSLIIPIKEGKHCQTEHSCKVHPWIRKLLMSIATSNAFLEFDSDGTPSEDYSRTRRAFLLKGRILAEPSSQKGKEKEAEEDDDEKEEEEDRTLTLYNIDAKYVEFQSSWFSDKKELRALQLGRWQSSDDHHIETTGRYFLEDLGACKNLRYLSLRGMSRVESLPDSIDNLGGLVVLDLRACHNLEKLTSKVSSLKNLEYLDVSDCHLLDQLPKGLKHLTKLQVLKGFVIGHATGKDPCRLSELETLEKLRKLSISVGQESNDKELQKLIEFKASLDSLTITWAKTTQLSAGNTSPAVSNLDKLQKLDMRAFPGKGFPDWISLAKLSKLKKLYIRGGKLETFGDNKTWQNIEVLRLRFLKHLSCNDSTPKDLFPKIRFVEIHACPKMSSWLSSEGDPVVINDAHVAASPQNQAEAAPLAVTSEIGAKTDAIAAAPKTQAEAAPAMLSENGVLADATAAGQAVPAVLSQIGAKADATVAVAPPTHAQVKDASAMLYEIGAHADATAVAPQTRDEADAAPVVPSEIKEDVHQERDA